MKFYKCNLCGNIIIKEEQTNPVSCCGTNMELLVPNTVEASIEKHLPICEAKKDKLEVTIGAIEHPMEEEHQIVWIAQEADKKLTLIKLDPLKKPKAEFPYIKDSIIYAYCNLHGLWETRVK